VVSEPVAWLFRWPDGSTRFILDDPERVRLWQTAHEGEVVPLYEGPGGNPTTRTG